MSETLWDIHDNSDVSSVDLNAPTFKQLLGDSITATQSGK